MEYLFDTHTHSNFSHDGVPSLNALAEAAINRGLKYLAITDHCDKDCVALPGFSWVRQIDLDTRKREFAAVKAKFADRITLAEGLEYGYAKEANGLYLDVEKSYPTDYVINSVHIVAGTDVYFREYFDCRSKQEAYGTYLKDVLASLDAPYHYDSVGHITYIARCATYDDKRLLYGDHADVIDEILRKTVAKGKALEVNTSSKGTKCDLFHDTTILRRYKELGGELVTIGSDTHTSEGLSTDFDLAAEALLYCGFRYAFVYKEHKPVAVSLEK